VALPVRGALLARHSMPEDSSGRSRCQGPRSRAARRLALPARGLCKAAAAQPLRQARTCPARLGPGARRARTASWAAAAMLLTTASCVAGRSGSKYSLTKLRYLAERNESPGFHARALLLVFSKPGGHGRGLAVGGPLAGRGKTQRFRPCSLLVSCLVGAVAGNDE